MRKYIFDVAGIYNNSIEYINKDYINKSCLYHNNGRKTKEGKQSIPIGKSYREMLLKEINLLSK